MYFLSPLKEMLYLIAISLLPPSVVNPTPGLHKHKSVLLLCNVPVLAFQVDRIIAWSFVAHSFHHTLRVRPCWHVNQYFMLLASFKICLLIFVCLQFEYVVPQCSQVFVCFAVIVSLKYFNELINFKLISCSCLSSKFRG